MERYVLKTQEAVLVPVEPAKIPPFLKKCVLIIWAMILVLSLLLQTNILGEMSGLAVLLLIGASGAVVFSGPKTDYAPSEMELQFYEDRLILYRPKRYYDETTTKREFCELKYADITSCVHKVRSGRIHIYGDGITTWYTMKKDGTFPDKPTKVKHYKGGLVFFSTKCATDIDFVKEIESHSPLRVSVENN